MYYKLDVSSLKKLEFSDNFSHNSFTKTRQHQNTLKTNLYFNTIRIKINV